MAKTKIQSTAKEIVTFLATAVAFFAVIFAVLNLPAYTKLMGAVLGMDDTPEISATVLGEKKTETLKTNAPISERTEKAAFYVPKMDLSIAPPDDRIIIPHLKIHAPIHEAAVSAADASNWEEIEKTIEDRLRNGTVHFPGTAPLGSIGNALVTGHSSYYPWDDGRYKDIFATLPKIAIGDDVIIWSGGKKYTYRIESTDKVLPNKTDILGQDVSEARLTLMTCYPIGTTLKRFIAVGKLMPEEQVQQVAMQ